MPFKTYILRLVLLTSMSLGFLAQAEGPVKATRSSLLEMLDQVDASMEFELTSEELIFLDRFLEDAIKDMEVRGLFDLAKWTSLSDLAKTLARQVKQSDSNAATTLKNINFHPHGPLAQWLKDEGWNSKIRLLLEVIAKDSDINWDTLAKSQSTTVSSFKHLRIQVSTAFTASDKEGLGNSLQPSNTDKFIDAAFKLDSNGHPKEYEPVLANILEQIKRTRARLALATLNHGDGVIRKYFENFYDRSGRYALIVENLDRLETTVNNLQGMIDALRYKATLANDPGQVVAVRVLLNKALARRDLLVNQSQKLFSLQGIEFMTFHKAFDHLEKASRFGSELFSSTRALIWDWMNQVDTALDRGHTLQAKLELDSPFEIKFYNNRLVATKLAKGEGWESIRQHKFLTKETYKTEHYTTIEWDIQRDKDGKETGRTPRTVHHNYSSTDYDYENVPTPPYEMEMNRRIDEAESRLMSAQDLNQLKGAQIELERLQNEQARYLAAEPKGSRDYSSKYQGRNRLLLQRIEALQKQSKIFAIQIGGGLQRFNAHPVTRQSLPRGVVRYLSILDARHRRYRKYTWTALAATVVSVAAGVIGCEVLLQPESTEYGNYGTQRWSY